MSSLFRSFRRSQITSPYIRGGGIRSISTLPNNPHIYVIPSSNGKILSLLPTDPPTPELSIGTTTSIPPTPNSFTENRNFLKILQLVLRKNVYFDPEVIASAGTFASPGGASIFGARKRRATPAPSDGGGAGGANNQGGAGSGGVGGYIHVFDTRNPPAFGRIPDPEDIFGSVLVDGNGQIQQEGYEECGSYRLVTNEGILGLSDYLRGKLIEKLKDEERTLRAHG
ncbi:uncharacterized protein LAJ45_02534 [Morchella importuna]|uniref:Uncharacterized protein n=1 Tax=Morchella conica CCBAS932 TaxID=1392247 RepID=A0A3N4L025_9PEZI|nr:uncharacterized protein LAJ45_02534 [Morchella importuna]KAH8153721.1 hypothetical protein LAJ45_02534 [Morchella importuna]RPB14872.1 hypothetical protein P167DRAFT_533855 [Morchella conica CCBAS932]